MRTAIVLLVVLGSAASVVCPGCSGYRDPATGTAAHYGCETLRAKLEVPIGPVYVAARKAAAGLHLRVARAAEDGISGEIRATNAHYDMVEIELGALPQERTALRIRVGPFGDRNKSLVLFDRIMANLNETTQVVAAPELRWDHEPVSAFVSRRQ
jgi:hypothetical protein